MSRTEDPDILIHPRRGKKEKTIPKTGILLVNPAEARNAHLIYKKADGESRFLFNSNLSIAGDGASFVAGPSIGAPMAVMTVEKLIALGASRIVLFGWCGAASKALSVGDVLIPDSALSGEGTSYYYNHKTKIEPSLKLNQGLEALLLGKDIGFKNGCVWSTDAIYREDRRLLEKLRSEKNVSAVDMEFSALCSVAKFRGIQFSAMLMVSDELWGETWKSGFSSTHFKKQCTHMMGLLFDHVSKMEIS
jgi:uridine phosphorylase